jgi:threonine synthase
MKYISTRGEAPAVGFLDAVMAGLAPDGGLYVPESWPAFTPGEIAAMSGQPYAEVAAEVLLRFAGGEISRDLALDLCREAYASFTHAAVAPLKQLYPGVFLLELFHGPSLAFKDVAMQLLARLYEHALKAKGRTLTIVCATSGDTGGAAVEAFRGRANIRVVSMFPDGRISEVQRRYMTTPTDANVACVALASDFDACQAILKDMFRDTQFAHAVDLAAVNSINFARIVAQAVYYFTSATALGAPHRPVAFSVPTGNFGDAFAGYVAHKMGLPIERIIVATNANDIVARALTDGRYARGAVAETASPAMDIQVSSNFERLYFEGVQRRGDETARAFRAFAEAGAIDIPPVALSTMHALFAGVSISESETRKTMLGTLNETGEVIDPHTAVALAGARRVGAVEPTTPIVVLSTAHPAKFPDTVRQWTGAAAPTSAIAAALAGKPERYDRLPAEAAAVKAYVQDFVRRSR